MHPRSNLLSVLRSALICQAKLLSANVGSSYSVRDGSQINFRRYLLSIIINMREALSDVLHALSCDSHKFSNLAYNVT